MARLTPGMIVEPPIYLPARHGLVETARALGLLVEPGDDRYGGLSPLGGARWEGGYEFRPHLCIEAEVWSAHCEDAAGTPTDPVDKSAAEENPGSTEVWPVTIETVFECASGSLPEDEYPRRAREQLVRSTSKTLERELRNGSLGLGQHLNWAGTVEDLTPTAGPASPMGALSILSQALADCGAGDLGMIHAPVAVGPYLTGGGAVEDQGGALRLKARGDVVVLGAGYDVDLAGETWMFATGLIEVRLAPPEVLWTGLAEALMRDPATGRPTNVVQVRAERAAAFGWACCGPFAVQVDTGVLVGQAGLDGGGP